MRQKIKDLISLALCIGTLLGSSTATAGWMEGTIKDITLVNNGTIALIRFASGGNENGDACPLSGEANFAFSTLTAEGKALLSTATAAFLAGKRLRAIGTAGNNCTSYTLMAPPSSSFNRSAETLGQLGILP